MRFLFMGMGTSVGVPQIGCDCPVCRSADPRDRRRRCGAYVRGRGASFLIDAPPDLREACLAYRVSQVDAVVLTHAHMDHVAGFDDLRRFNSINGERVACAPDEPGANGRSWRIVGKPMHCYAMEETAVQMRRIFPYVGTSPNAQGLFRPQFDFVTDGTFMLGGMRLTRLAVEHGFPCCGYLIEERRETGGTARIGYVSDCHALPDETVERLRGVDVMVLNCLRLRPHPTHLDKTAALAYLERISPRRAYIIHMCHDVGHAEWLEQLPAGVEPACDGLELEV